MDQTRVRLKILAWSFIGISFVLCLVMGNSESDNWVLLPAFFFVLGLSTALINLILRIGASSQEEVVITETWRDSFRSRLNDGISDANAWLLISLKTGAVVTALMIAFAIYDGYEQRSGQQKVEPTASSGERTEWVNGAQKDSQAIKQALQGTQQTGKKFTGLNGQETMAYVELNNGTVIYSKPITQYEASALAKFLVPLIFDGTKIAFVLSYYDGIYTLGRGSSAEEISIDGFNKAYALLARDVSAKVFQGSPVSICFFDKEYNILAEVSNSDGQEEFKNYQKSLAYQRGFEHGMRMGKQDREMASYDHLWPNSPENTIFNQVARLAGCNPGTPEYGDFADGYDLGYRAGR